MASSTDRALPLSAPAGDIFEQFGEWVLLAPQADQAILMPQLAKVRQLVYREKLENLQPALNAIENRLNTLQKLQGSRQSLAAMSWR